MSSKNDFLDYHSAWLAHYGVLGMHWGVRRYQPYSTVPRKSGKGGKYLGEAREVFNSLSSKEKSNLSSNGRFKNSKTLVVRSIIRDSKGSPKAFAEIERDTEDPSIGYLSIAVHKDSRGQGLSNKACQKVLNDVKGYGLKEVYWETTKDNPASGALAKKMGFKPAKNFSENDDNYVLSIDNNRSLFVSGSSKTQFKDSEYYRKNLPRPIKKELKNAMKENVSIIVGDAPGIDRQVQDFLNKQKYDKVNVYGPGKEVRYLANKKWNSHPIDAPEFEPGSKEWLAKKDIAMEKSSTEGLAIILDEGSSATRKNIDRLSNNNKNVKVYELNKFGKRKDKWVR